MQSTCFIFTGKSGCGKGTQAELLMGEIEKGGTLKERMVHIETGALFRDFITETGYSASLSKTAMETGVRQPDFMAVLMWARMAIAKIKEDSIVFFDGTPRSLHEAYVLDSAKNFYKFVKPVVVFMNISDKWAIERLRARGRADDDTDKEIMDRLAFYEKDVKPAIQYYRESPDYIFLDINGEQPIEKVHEDIMNELKAHGI